MNALEKKTTCFMANRSKTQKNKSHRSNRNCNDRIKSCFYSRAFKIIFCFVLIFSWQRTQPSIIYVAFSVSAVGSEVLFPECPY